MKITGKGPGSIQNPETMKSSKTDGAGGVFGAKRTKAGSAPGVDIVGSSRVEVSTRAQDMARAKELATPSDSIDEAKVARLQRLIDSGQYNVDAEAIADRLVDEHLKMS